MIGRISLVALVVFLAAASMAWAQTSGYPPMPPGGQGPGGTGTGPGGMPPGGQGPGGGGPNMMFGPGGQGGPPQGDDEMMEPGGGPGEDAQDRDISLNMLSRLGLSDEQIDRLCAEAYEPQVKSNQLKAELANLRFKMNCLKRKTNANPNEVKELYKKKGEIEGELFLIRQQSRAILESILTDEQKQRLNQRGPGRMNRNKP